ncbi:MAG: phytoene desaturase family protein [Spirochaetaceae bacterium]
MEKYDVIIVGAGMAGQVAAGYCAKAGKRVLLLEQNHQTGGNMSGFTRRGFYFDGGDQSFESLGLVFPILRELAGFRPEDFIKARYRMVSRDFDFFIDGPEHVEQELRRAFPGEPGITPLFKEIKKVDRFLRENYDPWDFPLINHPHIKDLAKVIKWLPSLKGWSTFRRREKELGVIEHPGLRNWLTHVGYYRMPYLFFAGFWHLWSYDYWYPRGGMQAMHKRLADAFEGYGGELKVNTLVSSIDTDSSGCRAKGVTTAEGEHYEADTIVYAGDYKKLINNVLGPEFFPQKKVKRLNSAQLTEGLVSVYLGLDMSDDELARTLNYSQHPFYFPNYDVIFPDRNSPEDVHRNMWVALNHFGKESPAAPEGKSTLTVQTFSAYDWQNYWRNGGDSNSRSAEYREFKHKVGMELVGLAENLVPGLGSRIEFMDVGTPLTLHRFTRNTEGASGGWCYDDQVSPVWRLAGLNRIGTPLPNLYAAGHYALWPGGVISAALCGRIVANRVLGKFPLAPIG